MRPSKAEARPQRRPTRAVPATGAAHRILALVLSLTLISCATPPESLGPDGRTGTWNGRPIGTPPAPNPSLKRAIIARAEQEWDYFGRQEVVFRGMVESIPLVGDWEDDGPRQSNRVNEYWRAVGQPDLTGMDCQKPWSAAFIGWIMLNAGVPADQFRPSIAHWPYLADLIESADLPGRYFVPRRLQDYSPEPGDLICAYRSPSPPIMTNGYVSADALTGISSHCDLVTGKHGRTLEAIGGNVRNSVSKIRIELDAQGHLQPIPRRPWFLIIQNRL
ncbi:DUF2272 domain-containing protein [Thermochromatium tepidum]|uniref:DUF2272 domain-containing protein n=1 Tax=Thermochromatium tepidum ATCC 43061 TaxID=316276 RepID=A0A6I6E9R3_THETI|nr:DUF2272 domain-containing protein [Thermochromatium tepidum]QGU32026.1 DUF2272 domain-containing protein [Thermochromatium tepidum ATCC 43061]